MGEFWVNILFMVVVVAVIGGSLIYWLSECYSDRISQSIFLGSTRVDSEAAG
ncbi:hypothetical protein ACQKOM_15430 [Peribacillus frigoritolerans]|uniref:hypothetical protein n=1 Tax=Peribacillus frigoritolerans TaxID=450367 RepID=UPI003820DAF2